MQPVKPIDILMPKERPCPGFPITNVGNDRKVIPFLPFPLLLSLLGSGIDQIAFKLELIE